MEVVAVTIERTDEARYGGVMTLRDGDGDARVWWSLERLDDRRAEVGFLEGDRQDWQEQVQEHALAYSDTILAGITAWRRQPVLELAS